MLTIRTDSTPLLEAPHRAGGMASQLLHGEPFLPMEEQAKNGLIKGTSILDGYVGWVAQTALTPEQEPPTHRVSVPSTFVYPKADIKTQPIGMLSLGARLIGHEQEGAFLNVAYGDMGGYVWGQHTLSFHDPIPDYVALAEKLCNTPYLWGGRGHGGIDCSGLVQLVLHMAGHMWPRDSKDQAIGAIAGLYQTVPPQRGDIVFWRGHVGLMRSPTQIIHASGHVMYVTCESLAHVLKRIDAPFLGVRRLGLTQ